VLQYFQEEITIPWQQFCIETLADLAIEFARDELISKIFPNAVEASNVMSNNEQGNEECQDKDDKNRFQRIKDCLLLNVYIEFLISLSTAWRWLCRLGFSYDARKKTFFVDGHERPNAVFRRSEFCKDYLGHLKGIYGRKPLHS
jgi:hypothetical protein